MENAAAEQKGSAARILLKDEVDTYLILMKEHGLDQRLRWNIMEDCLEVRVSSTGQWREWTDGDEARLRHFFQSNYGIYNKQYLDDALCIIKDTNRVNPLTDMLDSLVWDGVERIPTFLIDTVKCEDSPYNREVSRLIFAQGVARAYEPGCKCDDVAVLVGNQGGGKSTLVKWLNMKDSFYKEIKIINGKEGIEALGGIWIAELPELIALSRAKDAEAIKAYITTQKDNYRRPYEKHKVTLPRRCIFIGTTNKRQFLHDKTGNRRFYPVDCRVSGVELNSREKAIRANIAQCWAEAVARYKKGENKPYADPSLIAEIREQQESAMEDDWREGMIRDYLDQKRVGEKVCVIEIWYKALHMDEKLKPTRKDSNEIAQMIINVPGWVREEKPSRGEYGLQKRFVKIAEIVETPPEFPW